jgi:hypothetical protein
VSGDQDGFVSRNVGYGLGLEGVEREGVCFCRGEMRIVDDGWEEEWWLGCWVVTGGRCWGIGRVRSDRFVMRGSGTNGSIFFLFFFV